MAKKKLNTSLSRRRLLKGTAAGLVGASVFPHLWIPNTAIAQTAGRGSAKHILYIRLSGGFRFTTAFNADVADEFSPWGTANNVASGAQWGVGALLNENDWRTDELQALGLQTVPSIADDIAVMPCIDYEPLSGSADGNHQTGLERFLTGYVGGPTGLFTMVNYGLRKKVDAAAKKGNALLPAISLGPAGIGRGFGEYAAYRPPVLRAGDLDDFGFNTDALLPPWAREMTSDYTKRHRDVQNNYHDGTIGAYVRARAATKSYSDIFSSDELKINNNSQEQVDGLSNRELETIFGDSRAGRDIRVALRLFRFGCPAVYIDQGGYDMHSNEEENLPGAMNDLNHLISALNFALKTMEHPDGGTYWDHTIVTFGSEFSRSTRGSRFNSAGGSDHGGDLATRWMSMPFMGGPIKARGQQLGATRRSDLEATGKVYSYRAMFKSLMDALDCEHESFFPADQPFSDLFES